MYLCSPSRSISDLLSFGGHFKKYSIFTAQVFTKVNQLLLQFRMPTFGLLNDTLFSTHVSVNIAGYKIKYAKTLESFLFSIFPIGLFSSTHKLLSQQVYRQQQQPPLCQRVQLVLKSSAQSCTSTRSVHSCLSPGRTHPKAHHH